MVALRHCFKTVFFAIILFDLRSRGESLKVVFVGSVTSSGSAIAVILKDFCAGTFVQIHFATLSKSHSIVYI